MNDRRIITMAGEVGGGRDAPRFPCATEVAYNMVSNTEMTRSYIGWLAWQVSCSTQCHRSLYWGQHGVSHSLPPTKIRGHHTRRYHSTITLFIPRPPIRPRWLMSRALSQTNCGGRLMRSEVEPALCPPHVPVFEVTKFLWTCV